MGFTAKKIILGGSILALLGVTICFGLPLMGWGSHNQANSHEERDQAPLVVKTALPKFYKQFVRTVTAPAYVEPYFKVALFAQVAGPVKTIVKDYGDAVFEGEVLVEIDVPDLVQELAQKEALIQQAKADRDAAKAHQLTLKEAVHTSKSRIPEKQAALEEKVALRELRESELRSYLTLYQKNAITKDLVEEKRKDMAASKAAVKTAESAIETARSELRQMEAKAVEAAADLTIKEVRIQVARNDKERIQVQIDWAKIRAPFNGFITERFVEPGSFVQNATTANTKPMLTLMRLDKVKISMMVPERAARFLDRPGTEATVFLEGENGKSIKNLRGQVTRIAPSLDPDKGRTVMLEMEMYNPPETNYRLSCRKGIAAFLTPLSGANPVGVLATSQAARNQLNRKGLLRPGTYGQMKLILETFNNVYLIPSSSLFVYREKTCILQVKDNVARRVPVRVQFDDGIRVKVGVLGRTDPETGEEEEHALTGTEEIVVSGQGEIYDGQRVRPSRDGS